MTLQEYYKELKQHDWYYDWSDDHTVWTKGRDNLNRLIGITRESRQHEELYIMFKEHHFSGKPFGTEKKQLLTLEDFELYGGVV
jgi:hypothetical protein